MIENVISEETNTGISDYETERNKPMPNRIHGKIELEIGFQLKLNYNEKFDFATEVTLNTTPASTPDISIFHKKEEALDWKTIPAKETEVPLTTIEIVSPSQSMDEMAKKVVDIYFPMGVKSAWLVMPPPYKAIYVLTPDGKRKHFDEGTLIDPTTGIEIELEKVFVGMK